MKKLTIVTTVIASALAMTFLSACQSSENEVKKVGVLVPLENKALDEMVAGFTETLQKETKQPIKIKVVNAQGDLNLQRSMLQQMKDENYSIIAPIGTVATQMAAATISKQHIVSLAANYSAQERAQRKNCNITVVHDEISPRDIIRYIHAVYPQLTQLTLIHSTADKIFPDVSVAVVAGKELGIEIKTLMVPTLNELYSAANALPANTQGILILKDIMIASGINTLKTVANKRHIPLIASDQGSVQDGAAFAVGVTEKDIGVEGAKLASAILAGTPDCNLPIKDMNRLIVFVNTSALPKAETMTSIKSAANQFNYRIEVTNTRA